MTVLSAQTIQERVWRTQNGAKIPKFGGPGDYGLPDNIAFNIEPFSQSKQACGLSYGLTAAGYDIRVGKVSQPVSASQNIELGTNTELQSVLLRPGQFMLAASLEKFQLPYDLQAIVHDKSTLARQGLALQNTVLEPGWQGYITLEINNQGPKSVRILVGQPIAQIVFHQLDKPTLLPYVGKYQNQDNLPTEAKFTEETDHG